MIDTALVLRTILPPIAWVSLHTENPNPRGEHQIPCGRQPMPYRFDGDTMLNTTELEWESMPTATIAGVGIWSAETGGEYITGGPTLKRETLKGDEYTLPAGVLSLRVRVRT